ADSFARSLEQTVRAEGGFQHEHRVAAPGFGLQKLTRRFAPDFFVGGPQEDDSLGQRRGEVLQRIQSKQRLDNARFHIERSRTEDSSTRAAKRHLLQCAAGVDRVVVAEQKDLAAGVASFRYMGDAQVCAAMLLFENLNLHSATLPRGG